MSTRDKILDTALTLFNKNGIAAVSTNHIAAAAGISPGHLYYYYHNKEEIIRQLFERLYVANDRGFELPAGQTPTFDDLKRLVRVNYKLLWRYRGLYRELVALLRNDTELKARFLIVRKRGFEGFRQLLQVFIGAGVLRPPGNPQAIENIAELIWMVTEFWLNSLEISGRAVDELEMERGVQLMMQILQPYIKK